MHLKRTTYMPRVVVTEEILGDFLMNVLKWNVAELAKKRGLFYRRLDDRSRMTGDCHVRICGSVGGKSPRATRPVLNAIFSTR